MTTHDAAVARAQKADAVQPETTPLVIDCHGHYTTAPTAHDNWRAAQRKEAAAGRSSPPRPEISDADLRESIHVNQRRRQIERGVDITIFSPHAGNMGHHLASAPRNEEWSVACNDLIYRVTKAFPTSFAGACQLPQAPGVSPKNCVPELRRSVEELGFVACNVNPDPSGGSWSDPPLTDRHWYPLWEAIVELDVPAMLHVSGSANPNIHSTGVHYLNGDNAAFMQLLSGDLFRDFPTLRVIIPHGGGAVPYHWGRYQGFAADLGKRPLEEHLLGNVFFDSCVYHQAGIHTLTSVIPAENILFGSETFGAVNAIDPTTGHAFDDTRRYIDAEPSLTPSARRRIFEGTARAVYPRLRLDAAPSLVTQGGPA
ncbi:MAG: amidohydrolase family protein [Pseudoclavibacter sp.]